MAKTRIGDAAWTTLAGMALLVATAAASPAAAEPEMRLVAHLEMEVLGPPVTGGQLGAESGGFHILLPPAGPVLESETSAIILWDDCCNSGRGTRSRSHTEGTIRATSSY